MSHLGTLRVSQGKILGVGTVSKLPVDTFLSQDFHMFSNTQAHPVLPFGLFWRLGDGGMLIKSLAMKDQANSPHSPEVGAGVSSLGKFQGFPEVMCQD